MSCGGTCFVSGAPARVGCDACAAKGPDGPGSTPVNPDAVGAPRVGAASDVGRVRQGNEDAYLVQPGPAGGGIYAVADGMGGAAAGEVASRTAVEVLREGQRRGAPLLASMQEADRVVRERARRDPALRGMGTTLVALQIATGARPAESGIARVAHVGDSRAYLLRDGALRRLTDDHSLVGQLVRTGQITETMAAVHPSRNVVLQAIGTGARVDVEERELRALPGDRFLLCSDGVTGMIPDQAIRDLLAGNPDPTVAAARLIEAANRAGGVDNSTALVVDFSRGPAPTASGFSRGEFMVGAVSLDLSDEFLRAGAAMAQRLRMSWPDLLLVMNRESGISPRAKNPSSGAAGLIQFTNLAGVGWSGTIEQFLSLSGVEQLPYVERFLRPYANYNLNTAGRIHQALFVPATLPGSLDDSLPLVRRGGTRWSGSNCNEACIYEGHAFLDVGNKGYITAGDLETIDRRDAAKPGSPYSRAIARLQQILPQLFPVQVAVASSPLAPLALGAALGGALWLGARQLSRRGRR